MIIKKACHVLPNNYGHANLWKKRIFDEHCYHNSITVCNLLDDVEYIEGYVINGEYRIQHAWNKYNGEYFDLTYQLYHPKLMNKPREVIICGTARELLKQGYVDPSYKPLIDQKMELE